MAEEQQSTITVKSLFFSYYSLFFDQPEEREERKERMRKKKLEKKEKEFVPEAEPPAILPPYSNDGKK